MAVIDDLRGGHLGARLAEELLLPGGADDVGVRVPVADVGKGVEPAEGLVSGLKVDLRVPVFRGRVSTAGRRRRTHTRSRSPPAQADEVDVHKVVDLQPGDLLHRLKVSFGPPNE